MGHHSPERSLKPRSFRSGSRCSLSLSLSESLWLSESLSRNLCDSLSLSDSLVALGFKENHIEVLVEVIDWVRSGSPSSVAVLKLEGQREERTQAQAAEEGEPPTPNASKSCEVQPSAEDVQGSLSLSLSLSLSIYLSICISDPSFLCRGASRARGRAHATVTSDACC